GEYALAAGKRGLQMFLAVEAHSGEDLILGEMHHPNGFEHALREVEPSVPHQSFTVPCVRNLLTQYSRHIERHVGSIVAHEEKSYARHDMNKDRGDWNRDEG